MRFLDRYRRVWAWGRGSTYLRLYPNPGIGVSLGKWRRIAISWYGGIEVFRPHPTLVWQRVWSFGSRVRRPGSVR